MEFKDRLRNFREELNLSAAQVAVQFDKSEGAIRMWETGRSKPDADTLIKLAEYFNCTTDYLLGLSDYKDTAHADEHKAASDEAVSRFEDIFIRLDNKTAKDLASTFTKTIATLINLPHRSSHGINSSHSNQGISELIRLVDYVGTMYTEAAKHTAEWSEQNLMLLIGACFTYRKNIEVAMEVMLEDYLADHVEKLANENQRAHISVMLNTFFPNNDKIKSLLVAKDKGKDTK